MSNAVILQTFSAKASNTRKRSTVGVDLRQVFESLKITGRYRDWIRRVVTPILGVENVHQYEGHDLFRHSGRTREYFVPRPLVRALLKELDVRESIRYVREEDILATKHRKPKSKVKAKAKAKPKVKRKSTLEPRGKTKAKPNKSVVDATKGMYDAYVRIAEALGIPVEKGMVGRVVPRSVVKEFTIPEQGFSANNMYEPASPSQQASGRALRKTRGYTLWKRKTSARIREVRAPAHLNLNKPMFIEMDMGHMASFDTNNLTKSMIDAIAEAWGFNDKLVMGHNIVGHHVKSWDQVTTTIRIYNI